MSLKRNFMDMTLFIQTLENRNFINVFKENRIVFLLNYQQEIPKFHKKCKSLQIYLVIKPE
jgi:hypothetical protein